MNHNPNSGSSVCSPGITPPPRPMPGPQRPMPMPEQPCQMMPPSRPTFDLDRFPVGMGYVPWQSWENTYPLAQGFQRGTIFPSLDYPFVMGRCRR